MAELKELSNVSSKIIYTTEAENTGYTRIKLYFSRKFGYVMPYGWFGDKFTSDELRLIANYIDKLNKKVNFKKVK